MAGGRTGPSNQSRFLWMRLVHRSGFGPMGFPIKAFSKEWGQDIEAGRDPKIWQLGILKAILEILESVLGILEAIFGYWKQLWTPIPKASYTCSCMYIYIYIHTVYRLKP